MALSLICTVLNEGDNLRGLLDSIANQTRPPDEIVFVDGGSTDNTVAILHEYESKLPLRVLVQPGCNISAGRNRGIDAALGHVIAVTDAGVTLVPEWIERITTPLLHDPTVRVVAGWFEADPHTAFEAALGATTLPNVREIDPATFLPSSRSVAFRKAVWSAAGGYPEWIDYCEDLIFDLRLKQIAGDFAFAPGAVAHFRPRSSLASFYRQYYRYARGDGKADLWRKRHLIRYLTYLVVIPLIFLLGLLVHPLLWLLYVPGALVYLWAPYRKLGGVLDHLPRVTVVDRLYAALLVPIIRVVGDVAKMIGYPAGLTWRARMKPPDWRRI
ncbi:MAG: glycosyltransferase [Anaerolineae bacterium]|nr:glycosyltransferase [Anaerolineae bacterium]